jgi:quercetin dioxygenase-like cupin family protein
VKGGGPIRHRPRPSFHPNTGTRHNVNDTDRDAFVAALAGEGFDEVVTVAREPDEALDVHAHPFEAKALILEGELTIRTGETEQRYRAGDIFHLRANEAHSERYGPAGVRYLVGRK